MILKIKFMSSPHGLLYLFMLLIIFKVGNTEQFNRRVQCLHKERIALLKLKAELIDDHGRLSTWGNNIDDDDCCRWEGVICDNTTNHVVALDLRGNRTAGRLRGKKSSTLWSSSLIELNDLHYLDLSHNDFSGNQVSESIYSLSKLQHLDLSSSGFGGIIPHRLGNLSMLRHLNLSYSNFGGIIPHHLGNLSMLSDLDLSRNYVLKVNDNLDWLTGLHSLEYLDLSSVNLEMASSTWLRTISNLKTLKALYLQRCGLSETTALSLSSTIINDSSTTTSSSLAILDLSENYLNSTPALSRFLNLSISISYIDFSWNNFDGRILDSLGHLLSLSHLDLSYNQLQGDFPQSFKNLINLRFLNFDRNKLNGQFFQMMTLLESSTKLEYIDFTGNALVGPFPNMSRFSFLKELKLPGNKLNGPLLEGNLNLPHLEVLYVSSNRFSGSMLEGNLNLPHLEVLDVSTNRFSGRVPDLTSCSSSLRFLSLDDNMFDGTLTESIGYLSKLEDLSISSNQLEGIFSEAHLFNLSRLQTLGLSFNSNLTVKISSSWNPPFQLDSLWLDDCNLGPDFPKWLQGQKKLTELRISNTKIQDIVPDWFWDNFHVFETVDISYNQIHGVVPDLSSMFNLTSINLLSNQFSGSLPLMPPDVLGVILSNNSFSGTIVHFCNNRHSWESLDLSNNLLFGEIPKDFFSNLPFLYFLNLADNNFSGQIPNPLRSHCSISSLLLQNNNFSGQIPTSLSNCVDLVVVELGKNKLTGKIPSWLGKLPNLVVLSMKSNNFYGSLPLSICHLTKIIVLDISINKFSGTIPKCLNNFSSMSIMPKDTDLDNFSYAGRFWYRDGAELMWKGKDAMYERKNLGLLRFLDFSSNNLLGEIPPEITSLVGLLALNLSENNLVGPIPHDIGRLESLDSFDLSSNNLSGGIPATLSQMNQLGVLNLSFNNLSGRIPLGSHLQTFSDSSFMGNPGLCGDPLQSKPCPEDLLPKKPMVKDNDDDGDENSDSSSIVGQEFYICMALGFVISFCVVLGTIFHNRSCGIIFSKMLKSAGDWLYVKILVHKNRLKRHFEN